MTKRLYIEDFKNCTRICTTPDAGIKHARSEFCRVMQISSTMGKLFFWMIDMQGKDFDLSDAAKALHLPQLDIVHTLNELKTCGMIERLFTLSFEKESYEITTASLNHTQDVYCFRRLLLNH